MKEGAFITGSAGKSHGGGEPRRLWEPRGRPPNPDTEKESSQGKEEVAHELSPKEHKEYTMH